MNDFGIRFAVHDRRRFESLRLLFEAVKHDADAGEFRDPDGWVDLVPDDVKSAFEWPTSAERERWSAIRHTAPIWVPPPSEQLESVWDFFSVFESIESGEYDLLACEMVADGVAEMRIDPHSYPFGGVGPLIALAEAFGFQILGVNECGKYEPRADLLRARRPV